MKRNIPGAHVSSEGVTYAVWAPDMLDVSAEVTPPGGGPRRVGLVKDPATGYHSGLDPQGRAGDAYSFRIGTGPSLPDPCSRAQEKDVHHRSLVVDPSLFQWSNAAWRRPAFRDLVIYELHVGTFSQEGTFRGAIAHLPHLQNLGVNAIEIMPIADFPGRWNWGYDGVLIYAPARCYGSPDDLRALVDAAHAAGIAVILDVVYNHFGPDGNYLSAFSPHYFHPRHHTPWGNGFNVEHPVVREFFLRNPGYWMEEFHIDGFRFDATHEIQDDKRPHVLAEITESVHARGGYAIAEDARNEATMITDREKGGTGFDAVWADDFHHVLRVGQTGETHAYFGDFAGTMEEAVDVLGGGWLFRGQYAKSLKQSRGTDARNLPPERFVHCISNHDQVGNRAMGERLSHQISAAGYRALSALLCLTPGTPMLFMGQEWAASSPFLFFTDHHEDLGRAITKGRRKEFAAFPEFADPALRARIPDPQAAATFEASRLVWDEAERGPHAPVMALYRECLRLRRATTAFRPRGREGWSARRMPGGAGYLRFSPEGEEWMVIFDLQGGAAGTLEERGWQFALSSEEERFGGAGPKSWAPGAAEIRFAGPEVLVLRRV